MSTAIFFLALAFGLACAMFRHADRSGHHLAAYGWAFVACASVCLIAVLAVVREFLKIWSF
jgi:hypothetical protein